LGARSETKVVVANPTPAEVMAALSAMQFCKDAVFLMLFFRVMLHKLLRQSIRFLHFYQRLATSLRVSIKKCGASSR